MRLRKISVLSFSGLILGTLPLLSVYFSYIMTQKLKSSRMISIILSSFLALINSTKYPESDLLRYQEHFNSINNFDWNNLVREPLYYILTYIFSALEFNFSFFIFFTSIFTYFLIFRSIEELCGKKVIVANSLILIVGFMPEIFALSAHLVRQMMSIGLFAFGMSLNRKRYMFLSVLIHSSSLFFLCIKLCIDFFNTKKKLKLLVYGAISAILVYYVLRNIPFINYFFIRLENLETFTSPESLSDIYVKGCLFYFFCGFIILKMKKLSLQGRYITYLTMISGLSVVILHSINDLLAYRIFYSWLILMILVLTELSKNMRLSMILLVSLSVINIIRFSASFNKGIWLYDSVFKYFFNPFNI